MNKGAIMDGPYRYKLWRWWGNARPALFVMLNPSTADAERDDPTIRRCQGFAERWGYGGLEVVNLFAYRSTTPLRTIGEGAIGPLNDAMIVKAAMSAGVIVAAWGNRGGALGRDKAVLDLLERAWNGTIYCLGTTAQGQPRHPLYVRGDTKLEKVR